jgi:UDP-N-acetylmuramyl pentapeptide phosphotransferase/UDP-N-acetylglucosamine-1-phosphate transferase
MTFDSLRWFDFKILPALLLAFIFNLLTVRFWTYKHFSHFQIKRYKSLQRIHVKETPRLGGLIIALSLLFYSLISNEQESSNFIKLIFLSFMPAFFFSIKEDIFHNASPRIRFASLFISAILFMLQYKNTFPIIEAPYISKLLDYPIISFIFYSFAIVAISNGMNLVDGVNGLCAATFLSIATCLLFLAHQQKDIVLLVIIFILISLVFIFLLFNYPWGRIFLGDLGAYFLGFFAAILVIISYARHPELPTIGAVLILIYPTTEVIFSFFRRLLSDQSTIHPAKWRTGRLTKESRYKATLSQRGAVLLYVFLGVDDRAQYPVDHLRCKPLMRRYKTRRWPLMLSKPTCC